MHDSSTHTSPDEQPMDEPHAEGIGPAHPEMHPDHVFNRATGTWEFFLDPDNLTVGELSS
jgi:hypothetical protein